MELKKEQQDAIFTKDKDILVSAGAGSGKTFVMIERISKNIIEDNKSVTNMLVVTFTNAASNEMRLKLEKNLREKIASQECSEAQTKHIKKQLDMLGQADICTLHTFCQNIIKKYFYVIDIDPAFNILDENEGKVLSGLALENVLKEVTNQPEFDDIFLALDNKRNYDKVQEVIEKTYNFIVNQPDLEQFKKEVTNSYSGDIDENIFAKTINTYSVRLIDFYIEQFKALKEESIQLGFLKLVEMCDGIIKSISNINSTNSFSKNHFAIFNLPDMPQLPRLTKTEVNCEDVHDRAKALKTNLAAKLLYLKNKVFLVDDLEILKRDLDFSHHLMDIVFVLVEKYHQEFKKLKKQRNVLDFNDLEHYALQILKDEKVAEQIKKSYEQIFVDEYQDINDIQESIINTIYTPQKLFLVGDIKQSIYGFRNTNPQIFLNKQKLYKEDKATKVALPLNFNYRSDQKILSFINGIFGELMTNELAGLDYKNTSEMQAGIDFLSPTVALPTVEIDILKRKEEKEEKEVPLNVYSVKDAQTLDDSEQDEAKSEANIIITKINNLLKEQTQIFDTKTKDFRPIEFGDITLLTKSRSEYLNTIIAKIAEVFPIQSISKDTIFNEYEVQLLYSYLKLINNFYDDKSLLTCLVSPVCELKENDLANIKEANINNENFYQNVIFYMEKYQDNLATKLKDFTSYIYKGKQILHNGTIFDVLNYFVNATHFEAILSLMENGQERIKNVRFFINSFVNRSYNNDLFAYINYVENASVPPKLEADNLNGGNYIKVETMHHSKGLEYPIVFLVDCGHGFNRTDLRGDILFSSKLGLGFYTYDFANRIRRSTLARSAITISLIDNDFAENQRLLYVACTRAKNNLYIVGKQNLSKLVANKTEYSVRQSESYMALFLSTLKSAEIVALQQGKDKLNIHNGQANEFQINVYEVAHFDNINAKISTKPIRISDYNPEFERDTHKYLDFVYENKESLDKAYKNTVTGLMRTESLDGVNFTNTPKAFLLSENKVVTTSAEAGIVYHKVMSIIDFELDTLGQVQEFCQNNLVIDELKLIDCNKILACVRHIRPLLVGADKVLREQPFLMNIPYDELIEKSSIKDYILIQGIIDLIIVKNGEAILLDYKMTSIKDAKVLAEKYKLQLLCYQKAIESALNCKVNTKILYSFLQEVQIIV